MRYCAGLRFYGAQPPPGCILQWVGSDQWGKYRQWSRIRPRRVESRRPGPTSPLITQRIRREDGKTVDGGHSGNADRVSPYDYWQFWRNTADADVGRFPPPLHWIAAGGNRYQPAVIVNQRRQEDPGDRSDRHVPWAARLAEEAANTSAGIPEKGQSAEGALTVTIAEADLEQGISANNILNFADWPA